MFSADRSAAALPVELALSGAPTSCSDGFHKAGEVPKRGATTLAAFLGLCRREAERMSLGTAVALALVLLWVLANIAIFWLAVRLLRASRTPDSPGGQSPTDGVDRRSDAAEVNSRGLRTPGTEFEDDS